VGAATMMVIGNPLSAMSSAPEMLQLPMDGAFAPAGGHLAVLIAWALAGLSALVIAAARDRREGRGPRSTRANEAQRAHAYATR
jgi:hypothetical protein